MLSSFFGLTNCSGVTLKPPVGALYGLDGLFGILNLGVLGTLSKFIFAVLVLLVLTEDARETGGGPLGEFDTLESKARLVLLALTFLDKLGELGIENFGPDDGVGVGG